MISPHTASTVCSAAGYTAGLAAFVWMARRRRIASEAVLGAALVGLLGGLAGGGLAQLLAAGSAGRTVLGAIAGGYVCVAVYKRLARLTPPLGDLYAVALCAGEAVGRWGCYVAGRWYSKPTSAPWAIWQHGAMRHPTQTHMSGAAAMILALLLWPDRFGLPGNALFYIEGALYSAARFVIERCRVAPLAAAGLTIVQWACMAGMLFFLLRLAALMWPVRRLHAANPSPVV